MEAFIERKKVIILKIVFILTVIGTLIAFQYDHNRIMAMNTTTTAIVTNVGEYENDDSFDNFWVEYEFTVQNKNYSNKKSTNKKYNVGDSITIHYNPKKPKENCITISNKEGSEADAVAWLISLIIFFYELLYIYEQLRKKKWDDFEEKINTEIKINNMFMNIGMIIVIMAILLSRILIYGLILMFYALPSLIALFYFIKRKKALNNIKDDKELFRNLRTAKEIMYSGIGSVFFTDEYIYSIRLNIKKINYDDIDNIEYINHDTSTSIIITTKNKKRITISESNIDDARKIWEELEKRTPHLNNKQ